MINAADRIMSAERDLPICVANQLRRLRGALYEPVEVRLIGDTILLSDDLSFDDLLGIALGREMDLGEVFGGFQPSKKQLRKMGYGRVLPDGVVEPEWLDVGWAGTPVRRAGVVHVRICADDASLVNDLLRCGRQWYALIAQPDSPR